MSPDPNNISLWCISAVSLLVAIDTSVRLWTERHRMSKDDLNDEDRSLIWRIVLFLVFPILTLVDLRSTIVASDLMGGQVQNWTFGLMWFEAHPTGLSQRLIIPAVFAGEVAQGILCLSLLATLLFRPHPFLATLIGYSINFILGLNLLVEPLLAMTGLAANKWEIALTQTELSQRLPLLVVHVVLAGLFIFCVRNSRVRMWFSDLTRPDASDRLKEALSDHSTNPESARLTCRLGLMYDRAGLRRQAKRQLKRLKRNYRESIYTYFLDALMSYKRRNYELARKQFLHASDYPEIEGELKASLLAAAACAAFASGDTVGALNLSERSLEFDDGSMVARMVRVDAFLKMGRKEQAAEEILVAMHSGMPLDLENKVPLDMDRTFEKIVLIEETKRGLRLLESMSKN
ncbi:MAG: hypothetical protein K2X93_26435 [Candidatus Obscuribacterales bacterium]|nr:hypothetical protein [Candidatus Obscuribacterales bacterium]